MWGGGGGYQTYWDVIDIKDNCFVGANSTVLAGVTIGPNAIIAAGSMVNKDVPPGKVVGGVPARVIGDFETLVEKRRNYSSSEIGRLGKSEKLDYLWNQHLEESE